MSRYSESWLSLLKQKSDIVDILGKFLYLEKRGAKFWACCPFHREKTPSFVVNPVEQYYHCFSCGKSGNVINFLIDHERMSYQEAVEWLAKRAGMDLPEDESPEVKAARELRDKGLAASKMAARFYFSNLLKPEGQPALDYLATRKIDNSTVKEFGMGYSMNFYDLPKYLESVGYDIKTMQYAGLITITDDGRALDFQGGRLIIPIINAQGQVIGFGGRSLDGKQPKYKNTSGTPLFNKRKTLFGINLIKKLQKTANIDSIILVEGYMDVISLAQAGIKNAVASMGTSLTTEQCSELKRYTNKIYVSYDGDAAGQNATWRSLDMLADVGLDVKVVSMPDGLDPDDTIKKYGKDGFMEYVDKALPLNNFKIKTIASRYDLGTLDGKNKFVKATMPVLSLLDKVECELYIGEVSSLSGIATETIKNGLSEYNVRPTRMVAEENKPDEAIVELTPEYKSRIIACRYVLSSVLHLKPFVALEDLDADFFFYDTHKVIYDYIMRCIEQKIVPVMGDLFDIVPEKQNEINKIIDAIDGVPVANQEEYYNDAIKRLKKLKFDEALKIIVKKISEATSQEEKNKYSEEYRSLIKKQPK